MDGTPPGSGAGPSGDELVAAFGRWAAGERVVDAAQQRSRERWLRLQATEAATLVGIVTDLAERRSGVTLATRTRRLTGTLVGVAHDFCVLEDGQGAGMLVATAHLVTLAPITVVRSGRRDPSGDRRPPLSIFLIEALALLAADLSPVRLAVANGELLLGELLAVGTDVVTLRGDARSRGREPGGREHHYLPLSSIEVCTPR